MATQVESCPSNEEKDAVWKAFAAGKPTRVPLRWNANARIVLLDPALNPEGITFEAYFRDPRATLTIQARFQEYVGTVLAKTCDAPVGLPERWRFAVDNQNVFDGVTFGGRLVFEDGQVPSVQPGCTYEDADEFLRRDFSRPLEHPWIRERLAFRDELVREAATFSYLGRKGEVAPLAMGFDGPVTALATVFGADGIALLGAEPDKARALIGKITEAAIVRNRALADMAGGWRPTDEGWLADDSIQLVSTDMVRDLALPAYARWYEQMSTATRESRRRCIHLCGDATRHFPLLRDALGVYTFDTGFPVDHGALRRALGPEATISGGPAAMLLQGGTPTACAEAARAILQSGVMAGGRFILQEANNLPPRTPLANLQAVYAACQEYGRYE